MTFFLLDTSTPECHMLLVLPNGERHESHWQADRELARHLLRRMKDFLHTHSLEFSDISGIGVYRGPGSFTGLRIGLTVVGTIAATIAIPIVGATGDEWHAQATQRLLKGEDDRIVLPLYGNDARITTPKK